jgi:hypothetical protein
MGCCEFTGLEKHASKFQFGANCALRCAFDQGHQGIVHIEDVGNPLLSDALDKASTRMRGTFPLSPSSMLARGHSARGSRFVRQSGGALVFSTQP